MRCVISMKLTKLELYICMCTGTVMTNLLSLDFELDVLCVYTQIDGKNRQADYQDYLCAVQGSSKNLKKI